MVVLEITRGLHAAHISFARRSREGTYVVSVVSELRAIIPRK